MLLAAPGLQAIRAESLEPLEVTPKRELKSDLLPESDAQEVSLNLGDVNLPSPSSLETAFDLGAGGTTLDTEPEDLSLSSDKLLAQTPLIAEPEVIIQESQNPVLQTDTPVAPLLPRAVAPPVGDITISNVDATPNTIDLGTSVVVPRLVLREAPAREVLAVLARYAGFNLVFTDPQGGGAAEGEEAAPEQTVSLDLENESVQEVFNSVLMVSGLQANLRGRTIFVGSTLPQGARDLISRSLRLNQVSAVNAATYLASQGAEYQRLVSEKEERTDPLTGRVIGTTDKAPTLEALKVKKEEGSSVPFLLEGLTVATDERLNSLTLIGDPRQVQIATSMLTQLDARRRQAVVNVKVVDVQLRGGAFYNSSFSFGFDQGFAINDGGLAILNFGGFLPEALRQERALDGEIVGDPNRFLINLEAEITSGNGKILTDPTLVVQEGQQATVKLTQKVVESVETQVDPLSGVRTTTPVLADAGLTLTVEIDRIDDNGFINLFVSPTIAAPGSTEVFDSGAGATNVLTLLTRRELTSGLIRLRDGQTLILSGIIQETDRTTVNKVPLLGDIPILGALFRRTDNSSERSEVIIMLTPKIVDDNTNATFGYSYTPGPGAADVLRDQGFPVQPQP
jgi:type IV pilus assembly protein PilQ